MAKKLKYFSFDNVVRYLKSLGSSLFAGFTMLPFYLLGRTMWVEEMVIIGSFIGLLGIVTGVLSKGWANAKFWNWR